MVCDLIFEGKSNFLESLTSSFDRIKIYFLYILTNLFVTMKERQYGLYVLMVSEAEIYF